VLHNRSVDTDTELPSQVGWEDNCFCYCAFAGLHEDGGSIDSVFLNCEFARCEWYWGLFNLAIFVGVKFTDCTFRGTSFADCRFVECEFARCHFTTDTLGGNCSFEGSRWYSCTQIGTQGMERFVHAPK
jgi:uncharacterized protein YjbI with pentapeptide repeats